MEDGRIVVGVAGPLGREVAVYFGGEALPETVTAAEGERQLAEALSAGGRASARAGLDAL